jgi:proline dehydrogenase
MFSALHRAWQNLLIRFAGNQRLKNAVQSSRKVTKLVDRYIGGSTTVAGVTRAADLYRARLSSSMFFLGEYVKDESTISKSVRSILELVQLTSSEGLDSHISVDPTAIGYLQSPALCEANAFLIARAIDAHRNGRQGLHCLMLDMEDESLVDYTIHLHDRISEAGLPVALTLQAYLFRTQNDLQRQIERDSAVRLVKGAFVANSSIAHQGQREITTQYLALARMMIGGAVKRPGFYPIFGTHNRRTQEEIISFAQTRGLSADRYEIEMLLGVDPELASQLSSRGIRVRIYVPCGADWWGYVNRRIGESPRNALKVLRAICS